MSSRKLDQQGAGSVSAMIMAATVLFVAAGLLVVVGWLWGIRHARHSADLVAVSAAQIFDAGGDPCSSAKDVADRSGVALVDCSVTGDSIDFVVSVVVRVDWTVPVSASAFAGRRET